MCIHRFLFWLSTRDDRTVAELLVPPDNVGQTVAALLWLLVLVLSP